jgi:hypothetical protein
MPADIRSAAANSNTANVLKERCARRENDWARHGLMRVILCSRFLAWIAAGGGTGADRRPGTEIATLEHPELADRLYR